MTGAHPSDLELFEYVEGDLDAVAAASVRAHLETCPSCLQSVGELERGREALRASPLLELPELRRRAILGGLPQQERDHRPFVFSSPKRLLGVLTPIAVVAVVVAALVSATHDPTRDDKAAAPPSAAAELRAETAPAAAASPGAGAAGSAQPAEEAATAAAAVLSVAGPAADVAEALTAAGYPARVRGDGAVEVENASAAAVKEALSDRPAGDVQVFLRSG